MSGNVLDYSFMEVINVEDIIEMEPLKPPNAKKNQKNDTANSVAIRLSNNTISTLGLNFVSTLDTVTQNTSSSLRWIDLSFNQIDNLDPLLELENLAVLYLHVNKISSFKEIKKLQILPKLVKLTIHGNPVEEKKHYRSYVIHFLNNLHMLDFSSVTNLDRVKANTWAQTFRKRLGYKDEDGF